MKINKPERTKLEMDLDGQIDCPLTKKKESIRFCALNGSCPYLKEWNPNRHYVICEYEFKEWEV